MQGKRFSEMTIEDFKESIQVNLLAYVHLAKLFLDQKGVSKKHLVNVNSIAGHCACQANSDYCASKYGIHGFTDALRQELDNYNKEGEVVKMTNFYPYYIDTGLFRGFSPLLGLVIPMLTPLYVARRMYQAIIAEEKEVYIPSIIELLKNVFVCIPLGLRNLISQVFVGKGMEQFKGRAKQD